MSDVRHGHLPVSERPSLSKSAIVRRGPAKHIKAYFDYASAKAAPVGVRFVFGTFDELIALNIANRGTWFSIFPAFDPAHGLVRDDLSACIFGVHESGAVVTCHALHLFDMAETNFGREAEALRVYYADPETMRRPGERCVITADYAFQISGRVVFSGAFWCHGDFRGHGMARILPKLAKVYALARWDPDYIVSYMTKPTFERGLFDHIGYDRHDPFVELTNSFIGTQDMHFLSTTRYDLLELVTAPAESG